MWAVYMCGATDCFLAAMFMDFDTADQWAEFYSHNYGNPEGFTITFWKNITDIDTSDTGWEPNGT